MISTNALSIYILQHKKREICEQNICLIQESMRSDRPSGSKFKRISTYFPNLSILTKSATHGDIQAMYVNVSVGNKYLGKTITAFALAGSLEAPTVVSIDIECAFSSNGKKIRLLTTEVLLHAAADKLEK